MITYVIIANVYHKVSILQVFIQIIADSLCFRDLCIFGGRWNLSLYSVLR